MCEICGKIHPVNIQLTCGHRFSRVCLKEYLFNAKISSGEVTCPKCLTPLRRIDIDNINNRDENQEHYNKLRHQQVLDPLTQAIKERSSEFFQCECGFRYCRKCNKPWNLAHYCDNFIYPSKGNIDDLKCRKCSHVMIKHSNCNILTCICMSRYCYVCGDFYHKKHYEGMMGCQSQSSPISLGLYIVLHVVFMLTFPISILIVGIRFFVNAIKRSLNLQTELCKKVFLVIGFIIGLLVIGPIAYGLFLIPYFIILWIRVGVFGRRYCIRKQLVVPK